MVETSIIQGAKDGAVESVPQPRGPGRPKGSKNKRTDQIEQLMRPLVPGALRRLRRLVRDAPAEDKTAYAASMSVLAYVYGKPIERLIQQIATDLVVEQRVQALVGDPRETGRMVALILRQAELAGAQARSGGGPRPSGAATASALSTSPADVAEGAIVGRDTSQDSNKGGTPSPTPGPSLQVPLPTSTGLEMENEGEAPEGESAEPPQPEPGETAYIGVKDSPEYYFSVECSEGSRDNLPPSYSIYDDHHRLLTRSVAGWEGVMRWVRMQIRGDTDLTVRIPTPTPRHPAFEPTRPDQIRE
jgi:hypothetical protein